MRCGGSCWNCRGRSPPPETMTGKILIILGAVLVSLVLTLLLRLVGRR